MTAPGRWPDAQRYRDKHASDKGGGRDVEQVREAPIDERGPDDKGKRGADLPRAVFVHHPPRPRSILAAVAVTAAIAIAIITKSLPIGGSRMMPPPNIPATTPVPAQMEKTMCPEPPAPAAKAGGIAKVQAAMTAKAREILRPVARPEVRPASDS